jgi:hypothetical protein
VNTFGLILGLTILLIGLAFDLVIVQPLPDFNIDGTVQQPYSVYPIGFLDSSKMDVCVTAKKPTMAYLLTSDAYGMWQSIGGTPARWGNVSSFQLGPCSSPPSSTAYYLVLFPIGNESGYHFSESVIYYPFRDEWQLVAGIGAGVLAAETVEIFKDQTKKRRGKTRRTASRP